MNVDIVNDRIRESQGFEQTVGMQFISTPEPDTCKGQIHVGKHLLQPFGYLSGGVVIALAETLAGVGSVSICPDCKCVGINVNANHVHSAKEGETLTALGHLVHKGGQTHVWRVDVTNESDQLISTVTVTNFVKPF